MKDTSDLKGNCEMEGKGVLQHSRRLFSHTNNIVKKWPIIQEMGSISLGEEDPKEEDTAVYCSILGWRIP